jgi:ComF family protein
MPCEKTEIPWERSKTHLLEPPVASMFRLVSDTLHSAADLLWPRRCLHCDEPTSRTLCLCESCVANFDKDTSPTCPRCTSTVGPHTDVSQGCPRCRSAHYRYASAQRWGVYDGELRNAILRMKYRGGESLAEAMGVAWAASRRDALMASSPHVVAAVPLHWRKRWARGFDQAELLARGVAEGLGLPFAAGTIRRVKATPQQSGVSPTERRENLKNAFRPSRTGVWKAVRVLLVDDVLTTGATADAASAAILAGGAAQVDVAVLAHR